jgi:hypothetical protein
MHLKISFWMHNPIPPNIYLLESWLKFLEKKSQPTCFTLLSLIATSKIFILEMKMM